METSIYGTDGRANMYIADDSETIYTWEGYAVCYLVDEKIYCWRGKHLGWFLNGILYDLDGYRIGYTQDMYPRIRYTERTKWTKKTKRTKYTRQTARTRPTLKTSESTADLEKYFSQDH
ncbi:4-fold beta flower protein [Mucilaginibacter daejeonensis]|uniref:4-fold beta flower protein n=1 Tax=Mucilaginibacter daejeonensis TaxID=398049 RepID=UPI00374D6EAE